MEELNDTVSSMVPNAAVERRGSRAPVVRIQSRGVGKSINNVSKDLHPTYTARQSVLASFIRPFTTQPVIFNYASTITLRIANVLPFSQSAYSGLIMNVYSAITLL